MTQDHPDEAYWSRQRYIRSRTTTGENPADWIPSVIVSGADGCRWPDASSFVVVDGNPAIIYQLGVSGECPLKYTRSTTNTGESASDWITPIAVAYPELSLIACLAVIDGVPAVAYAEGFANYFGQFYNESTTSTGASPSDWGQGQKLTDDPVRLGGCSLIEVNGNPAIAYTTGPPDGSAGKVIYAYYDR